MLTMGPFFAVAAGGAHTAAIKVGGELICFGANGAGQRTPPLNIGSVIAVSTGLGHTAAIKADGELICFGDNYVEQCNLPPNMGTVTAVAAGCHLTAAITAGGNLIRVWGHEGIRHLVTDMSHREQVPFPIQYWHSRRCKWVLLATSPGFRRAG